MHLYICGPGICNFNNTHNVIFILNWGATTSMRCMVECIPIKAYNCWHMTPYNVLIADKYIIYMVYYEQS